MALLAWNNHVGISIISFVSWCPYACQDDEHRKKSQFITLRSVIAKCFRSKVDKVYSGTETFGQTEYKEHQIVNDTCENI